MKIGYVSIIGKPNVGKSTLLNNIVDKKISIITNKPQTTRNKIFAIYKDDDSEIIFIDTPGFHKPKNKLDMFLNSEVKSSLKKSNLCFFITDPTREFDDEDFEIIKQIESFEIDNVICLINKIDIADKEEVEERKLFISKQFLNFKILEISSIDKKNIENLLEYLKDFLEDSDHSIINEMSELNYTDEFLVNEIVREKILLNFKQEVPHSVAVVTEKITYEEKNNITKIYSNIIVEKESQKPIIIGKGGSMIKKIGIESRQEWLNSNQSQI